MALAAGITAAGTLASTGLSLLGSNGGTSVYKTNKINRYQEKLQEKYLQNYYTNARSSLEKANYNPVLAYMNTPSGGSTSAVAQEGNSGANAANVANAMVNAKRAFDNEQKQTESTVNLQNAQRHNVEQDTQNKEVQHGILELDKQIRSYESEMKKFDKDSQQYRFYQEMKEMASRTKLNLETANNVRYNAESNRIMAQAAQSNAQTNATRMDIETAPQERYNEWAKEHPVLASINETTQRHLPGVVGAVGAATGVKRLGIDKMNADTNARKIDLLSKDESRLLEYLSPSGEIRRVIKETKRRRK